MLLDIVARILEYSKADGYQAIQVIKEPADDRILVTITRPGGGMDFVTLTVKEG